MVTIIKGAKVYEPKNIGSKDIVLFNDKIEYVGDKTDINVFKGYEHIVIDGSNKILAPGLIDGHVHIAGGGGEGGFHNRTPEIKLSDIISFGVTTCVGLLGTDGNTRNVKQLLGKAKALEDDGISTYIYSGSYDIYNKACYITGDVKNELIFIDKVIGIGEIALSDHRGAYTSLEAVGKLIEEARVGGILSNKAGIVHFHMGDGKDKLKYLFELMNNSDIPVNQYIPTHVNRNKELLNDAINFASKGGMVDLTSSIKPSSEDAVEVKASRALKMMLERGISINQITMSSDGQGSAPVFDSTGNLKSTGIASLKTNIEELKDMVSIEGIPLELALQTLTSNVAKFLKLDSKKGRVKPGLDADIVLFNEADLSIDSVIAKGQIMIKNGKIIKKGTFE